MKSKQSIDDLNLLIDNHPDAMIISDLKGTILDINEKLAQVFGKRKEELIGTSGYDHVEVEVGKRRRKILEKVIKTKKPMELIDQDKGRWWKAIFHPILDDKGNVVKLAYYIHDITDEKEAKQNLEKKQIELSNISKKYQFITNNVADVIMQVTLTGKITYITENCEAHYGYKQNEVIGENFTKFAPKSEWAKYFSKIKQMLSGKKIHTFETIVVHKNGDHIPVDFSGQMVKSNGKSFFHAVMRNISEKIEAEQALRESELQRKFILDTIPDLLFIINDEGFFTNYHGNVKNLYQPPKLFLNKRVVDVLPKPLGTTTMEYVKKALITKKIQIFQYTLKIKNINKWYESRMLAISKKNVISIIRDITERKKSEEEIKKSKDYLQNVIDSTSEVIFTIDSNYKIRTWNKTAEKITGYKKRQVVGRSIKQLEIFDYPSEIIEYIKNIQNKKTATLNEISINTIYGIKRIFSVSPSYIKDETDKITEILLVCRDITQEKETFGKIQSGYSYLIQESVNNSAIDVFNSLLLSKKLGLYIGRMPNKEIQNSFKKIIPEIIKLTAQKDDEYPISGNIEDLYQKIKDFMKNKENTVILIDRIDYLITKYSFESVLKNLYKINDLIQKQDSILILRVNTSTIKQSQISILNEEFRNLPSQQYTDIQISQELYEILKHIQNEINNNISVTYGNIGKTFSISKVTAKKRLETLRNLGLIYSRKQGKTKILNITIKGNNLLKHRKII